MENQFSINLIHDVEEIQNIIDSGSIKIVLEESEIQKLRNALSNGNSGVTMFEKSPEEYEREQMLNKIDTLQELLNAMRQELQ